MKALFLVLVGILDALTGRIKHPDPNSRVHDSSDGSDLPQVSGGVLRITRFPHRFGWEVFRRSE